MRSYVRAMLAAATTAASVLALSTSALAAVPDTHGGVYVFGDSISAGQHSAQWGGNPTPVPYNTAAAGLLANATTYNDSISGASAGLFRSWGLINNAKASKAKLFIIELGTNDASCLHDSAGAGDDFDDVCPSVAKANKFWQAVADMQWVKDQLLAIPGSCVLWIGPRQADVYGTYASEWANYDNTLSYYAGQNPGRFAYADLTAYGTSARAQFGDFTLPNGREDVHLHTSNGAFWLSQWAITKARDTCPSLTRKAGT